MWKLARKDNALICCHGNYDRHLELCVQIEIAYLHLLAKSINLSSNLKPDRIVAVIFQKPPTLFIFLTSSRLTTN